MSKIVNTVDTLASSKESRSSSFETYGICFTCVYDSSSLLLCRSSARVAFIKCLGGAPHLDFSEVQVETRATELRFDFGSR